ncbi:protein Jade-1 [Hippocampus comes]|uniref:Protein Jade-1 n=1 Tax=Hippocampus comes TaxID=109280 RepID=A0A3Q2YIG3_HIPCM|nr:PREDICTED: protein Jade-1-like [Hippocampus comes]XP_019734314.1 PREDICTED: protein Jade-1-like [Hippocampus comes]XP_019734323.1 PREDICTED: protein Jade-1-like [Hippocampus comes]XP_019734332.1 PREDICTED: protein Jade-1-like [Hippocampus comes]
MKRSRHPSSSDDSDDASNSTCWSQHSSQARRGSRQKPSEVFRTDLITAMKVHDSYQLNPEDFYVLADPWRQEWEKGVQVPVSPQSIPQPAARPLADGGKEVTFVRPKKLIRTSAAQALGYVDIRTLAEGTCRYDLNEEDVTWLQVANQEFAKLALPPLDEFAMERALEEFERRCHDNMTHATETQEGLGIEYDEDVVCDVCQSPDGEDNNEMVFCDKCNICVHQACYGIQKVPKGSWLCRICALGILPKCQLCPKKGGAMKPTRSGTKWVHVSCALWIPEVSIGNPEKMEPITNVSHIPSNRWALNCCLCKEKTGACIQCSAKNCRVAFHVTCGLHAGLEMTTLLTQDDEVKFKSYCPKHSGLEGGDLRERDSDGEGEKEEGAGSKKGKRRGRIRGDEEEEDPAAAPPAASTSTSSSSPSSLCLVRQRDPQDNRVNLRKMKLQEMEEVFYQFVDAEEVGRHLKMAPETVDFLYQYWKLKRKANFNQPLLTPKKDEEDSLARREHEVLLRRLQLFTHLRQDLERVRNLTYMVTRREKMKRSLWRVQEQIFQHQIRLIDQELLTGNPSKTNLQRLFSEDHLNSLGCHAGTPWSHSAHKTKRRSKQDKGKSRERKGLSDSLLVSKKDIKTLDAKSLQVKESGSDPQTSNHLNDGLTLRHVKSPKQEVTSQEGIGVKPHRKTVRREAPGPERRKEKQPEHEERKRKRWTDVSETSAGSQKVRFHPKHLDKTVSIRLVDIRSSDAEEIRSGSGNPDVVNHGQVKESPSDVPRVSNGSLKGWGKFRIPKRSEKTEPEQRKQLLRPLTNTPTPGPQHPRTRLRTGAENEDGGPEVLEPCLKRCHSHQLRGDASLSRRYGSDIIRRGVLAS